MHWKLQISTSHLGKKLKLNFQRAQTYLPLSVDEYENSLGKLNCALKIETLQETFGKEAKGKHEREEGNVETRESMGLKKKKPC